MTNVSILQPPYCEEEEQHVLSAAMLNSYGRDVVLDACIENDFYRTKHRRIFGAIRALSERNDPIDVLTVAEHLKADGDLDQAGGIEYLDQLDGLVPTSAAAAYYADLVIRKAQMRDLLDTTQNIAIEAASQEGDELEKLERAEKEILKIRERRKESTSAELDQVVRGSLDLVAQAIESKSGITGVPTGIKALDQKTSGLQPSDLIIIAGRPSMGKTAFALDITRNAAAAGTPGAVFSLEMNKDQLGLRMVCSEARFPSERLRSGFLGSNDWPSLTKAAKTLASLPIVIDDQADLTVTEMRARCRRMKQEKGLGLVVVDYLQLLNSSIRAESRQIEVAEFSRSLKRLAKELNVPVVALSQLSRSVESRTDKRPLLSDLRESGSIEQDADVVMFIYRDEYYNQDSPDKGIAEVLVRKQRNGPTGDIRVAFNAQYTRFDNLEEEHG